MIEFELHLGQIKDIDPLTNQLLRAHRDGETGMIIAQIIIPDMVVRAEFVEHARAEKIIAVMQDAKE